MNPLDAFPRRNLPPEAEEWGREVEARTIALENAALSGGQTLGGLNRTSAASLESMSQQLSGLATQVERVDDLYDALPKAYQKTASNTGFGLPSSAWNTVATNTYIFDKNGTLTVVATASGSLATPETASNMECDIRITSPAGVSPPVAGLPASPSGTWRNTLFTSWGWTIPVIADTAIVIAAEINPVTSASWPSGTSSTIVLSSFATFTSAT